MSVPKESSTSPNQVFALHRGRPQGFGLAGEMYETEQSTVLLDECLRLINYSSSGWIMKKSFLSSVNHYFFLFIFI